MDNIFFIVSKIVSVFISPINFLIILIVSASLLLFFNKIKLAKKILFVSSIGLFVIMLYPVGDNLISPLEARFPAPTILPAQIDGIILLGGAEKVTISNRWQRPELSNGGDRYLGVKELINHYPNAPVVFTGGDGSLFSTKNSEAWVAKQILSTLGIPKDQQIIESKSRNTYENFKLTKPLLPKIDGTYMLVTSAFHMPRSVGIARKLNIKVIAYPVDYRSSGVQDRNFDFKTFEHLKSLEAAWREWIGLTVYYITNKTSAWLPSANDENGL